MLAQIKFNLDEHSIEMIDAIQKKYNLKSRDEALNRFLLQQGTEFLDDDFELSPEELAYYDKIVKEHEAKYGIGKRTMTLKELDKLLGLDKK